VGQTRRSPFAFKPGDQFAPELIYFSDCILNNRLPEPSRKEGLNGVRVINAIYESAKTGEVKRIEHGPKRRRPSQQMEIKRQPVEEADLVSAVSPRSR
jgi:hypothetical protein